MSDVKLIAAAHPASGGTDAERALAGRKADELLDGVRSVLLPADTRHRVALAGRSALAA